MEYTLSAIDTANGHGTLSRSPESQDEVEAFHDSPSDAQERERKRGKARYVYKECVEITGAKSHCHNPSVWRPVWVCDSAVPLAKEIPRVINVITGLIPDKSRTNPPSPVLRWRFFRARSVKCYSKAAAQFHVFSRFQPHVGVCMYFFVFDPFVLRLFFIDLSHI